jgi:serine phosphatase RsbU (regulator of sigma subunit)/CHASE3 domain sensor protein
MEAGLTRARGAFVLTVGFIVLLSSAIWLYRTVAGATDYQRDVRLAQSARDRVFRALLDQETSMRGFTSTRQIVFLMPYGRSQEKMDGAFADLSLQLKRLGAPQLLRFVDEEIALHKRWHETVAAPLLAAPRRPDATRLQYIGKSLVDEFRDADSRLDNGINQAATAADAAVNVAVVRVAVVTAVFGLAFAAAFLFFETQRARMSAETARQRMLYENEKRIADALQGAFVQKALPVLPNLGFHASYIPAGAEAQVGGDWYDAFVLPDGRILFSIGDVAGHGIEAAVIMSRARQAIISSALHESDPAIVLSKANESLMLQEPKMVTAICGYIEPQTLRIDYATAGHPAPILAFPGKDPYFLKHDGLPLGILPGVRYESFTAYAAPGALLVLYTDGVIEHKRDVIDGERRLLAAARLVVSQQAHDPAASVRRAIFTEKAPDDDVAIMTVSFLVQDSAKLTTVNAFLPAAFTVVASSDDASVAP